MAPRTGDPAVDDRRRSLAGLDPAGVAGAVARVPLLAAAVAGRGPLAAAAGRRARHDPDAVAALLSSPAGISVSLASCSPTAYQLAQVLRWYGRPVPWTVLRREADGAAPELLTAAVDELTGMLLARSGPEGLALRPGVERAVPLPGPAVRDLAEHPWLTNADLDAWLAALGRPGTFATRRARLEALAGALGDVEVVEKAVAGLSVPAVDAFARLCATPTGLPVSALGCGWYGGAGLPRPVRIAWSSPPTPVHELVTAGLVQVDVEAQWCAALLDAVVALVGRLHVRWPAPAEPVDAPLRTTGGLPAAPGHMTALLERWRRRPAEGRKSGGLAVRAVTTAAKHLGIAEADGRVLGRLADAAGLVEPVVRVEGHGRRATARTEYVPGATAAAFSAAPFAHRWAVLVGAWLDEDPLTPQVSLVRRTLVAELAALPPGRGVEASALATWAGSRRVALGHEPELVAGAVGDLRALGLVPPDGPVGLTDHARRLLTDPASLVAAPAGHPVVVQADHTVVVPPDADPDVVARLERLGEPVSTGAARVYRLEARRLAAAVADGDRAEDLVAFLEGAAGRPPPPTVARLVADAARSVGGLRAVAAATVVVAADPGELARALAVKAAGLAAVAPTVAVSLLPPARVDAALRAKGVHLDTGAADTDGTGSDPASELAPARPTRPLPAVGPLQPAVAAHTELLAR